MRKILYNRIVFFALGVVFVVILYLFVYCPLFDSPEVETEYPEIYDEFYFKSDYNPKYIPDSVLHRVKWVSVGHEKIENFYRIADNVYWSDEDTDFNASDYNTVEYSDADSFRIALGTRYAKDKNYVYWTKFRRSPPIYMYDDEKQETRLVSGNKAPVIVMWGADPETFVALGYGFACYKNSIYFEEKKIDWDDGLFGLENCRQTVEVWKDFVIKNNLCNAYSKY